MASVARKLIAGAKLVQLASSCSQRHLLPLCTVQAQLLASQRFSAVNSSSFTSANDPSWVRARCPKVIMKAQKGSFSCHEFVSFHSTTVPHDASVDNTLSRLIIGPPRYQVKVQYPAPDFQGQAVVNGQFKEIKSSDFKGKYLVLFFYPLDFTFVCPTELIAFSDNIKKFKDLNTEVVGVSTDSHFSHLAWINTPRKQGGLGGLNYPLLSDINKSISRDFCVLVEDQGISLRGLFIIDPNGVVRQITINDLPVGRSVDEVLRLIQAFQFVEKHGEVCPANWKPESPTIKPTPEGSKSYFERVN